MIILLLFLLISPFPINASHFNGGTITWAPIDPDTNSSSVDITIAQTYSWTYPIIICATNVPVSSGRSNANLTCIANCSTDGGYSNAPITILTDCTSFSSSLGMMFSQRSVNTTLNLSAYFYIAYIGNAWRNLYNPPVVGLSWSIVALIDLRLRSDGIINTPPVANVISPQYIMINTTSLINIHVSDVNEGDDIRCRWAINNISLSIDECSGICYPTGLPSGTTLSSCTLSFTGSVSGVWYAIALQIEDFMNTTSTEPMSSVPVQFLIYVLPTPTCTILPLIIPLTVCLEVEVNVTTNFTLYIMNLCNSTATITDIIISQGISGLTTGSLTNSTTNNSLSYIPLTWTPQVNQIGSQELCVIAYNNLLVQSVQYCVMFTVTTSTLNCSITTTTSTELIQTESPNQDKNQIIIPLIIGLSLLTLFLTLCCCCCWLYYLCRSGGARRRYQEKPEKRNVQAQKYPQLLPFRLFNKIYISNARDREHTIHLSAQTLSSCMSKNQIPIDNIENVNVDQSFPNTKSKSSHHHNSGITKLRRNKISTTDNIVMFNNNQEKDRSTSNISIHQDETSIIRKTRIIIIKSSMSGKRQRSRSTEEHSSKY